MAWRGLTGEAWKVLAQGGKCLGLSSPFPEAHGPPLVLLRIQERAQCQQGGCGAGPAHQSPQEPPTPSLLGLSRGRLKGPKLSPSPSGGGRLGLRLCSYLWEGLGGATVASEGTHGRRVSRQGQLTSQAGAWGLEGRLGSRGRRGH